MTKDLYEVLGLERGAEEKAIKAAYRRLARKYHPNLNAGDAQAEAKFKEVAQAYEVLSDPDKRATYDKYGVHGDQADQFQGHQYQDMGDIGSIFEQFLGGIDSPFTQPRPKGASSENVEFTADLTLEEIDTGTTKTLRYTVNDACKSCDGTGQVRLRNQKPCRTCSGSGRIQSVFGQQMCPECRGTGRSSLENCPTCRGKGVMPTNRKVDVKIPAGIQAGKKLRIPGGGSMDINGRSGDLYVVIREVPHPNFVRKGDDLETTLDVPFDVAALGGEMSVTTLRGRVRLTIAECTQNGQIMRLTNQGLASMKGGRGNLMVKVKISIPKSITPQQREALRQFQIGASEKP